jgi:hypothetical protein
VQFQCSFVFFASERYYPAFLGIGIGTFIEFLSFTKCVKEKTEGTKKTWIRVYEKDTIHSDLEEYRKRKQQQQEQEQEQQQQQQQENKVE